MATLRQLKKGGSWYVDYIDVDNQRYRVCTHLQDKKLAQIWLNKVEELLALARLGATEKVGEVDADVIAGRPKRKESKSITLEEFMAKYEERSRHDLELAESTISLGALAFRSFIRSSGNKPIGDITVDDVVAWKRKLAAEGRSKTTMSIYHRALRAAFERAVKWDMSQMQKNPFSVVEVAQSRNADRPPKDMSIEDVMSLLKAIDDAGDEQFGNFIRFLLYTGCRRSEILRLKWEDLDLENWTMKIFSEKTKRSIEIPINKALQRTIAKMEKKERGFIFLSQSHSRNAKNKQQPWHKSFVTHKYKSYIRATGLAEHYSLHSLRHTYATYLHSKGVPLDIIYRLLAHSSPAVTAKHYSHSLALHFRAQADLVDFEGEDIRHE